MAPLTSNRWILVSLIALSPAVAAGVVALARRFAAHEALALLWETAYGPATTLAWALAGVTALASALGVPLYRALHRRGLARLEGDGDARARRNNALTALYAATSAPQLPALLAIAAYMAGAEAAPVALAVALATAGAFLVGAVARDA